MECKLSFTRTSSLIPLGTVVHKELFVSCSGAWRAQSPPPCALGHGLGMSSLTSQGIGSCQLSVHILHIHEQNQPVLYLGPLGLFSNSYSFKCWLCKCQGSPAITATIQGCWKVQFTISSIYHPKCVLGFELSTLGFLITETICFRG